MNPPAKRWVLDPLGSDPMVRRGPAARAWRFVARDVWGTEPDGLRPGKRFAYRWARVLYLTLRSFDGDRCVLRAAALTYTTVLSLVPLLAFSFAILKGLGFYSDLREQRIDPYLNRLFGEIEAPPPSVSDTLTGVLVEPPPEGLTQLRSGFDQVLNLVDQTDVKGLGAVGLLVLLLAALRLLSSIEAAFNEIWGVGRPRRWIRKLSDYLTIVIITPILLVLAVALTTAVQNAGFVEFLERNLPIDVVVQSVVRLAPLLIASAVFTLVYLVMPNRRTRLGSAAIGGVVAGCLWQLALQLHIAFQIGVANYNAIYAGFAALPIFLVWVQTSWLVVLFGAELAFAHESEREYHGFATVQASEPRRQAFKERVALRALTRIADAFLAGAPPLDAAALGKEIGVHPREVDDVLGELARAGVVSLADGAAPGTPTWLPARSPERIRVDDVVAVLRGDDEAPLEARNELDRHLERLLGKRIEEARTSAFNLTLRELVDDARRRGALEPDAALHEPRAQPS
jgi:membrane protein